jgi:hypothetical protein
MRALLQEAVTGFGRVLIATSDDEAVRGWTKRAKAFLDTLPPTAPEGMVMVPSEAALLAKRIHYPECWDTVNYPTLLSALIECVAEGGCTADPCMIAAAGAQERAVPTFEQAWAKKEAEGYRYGHDALEQVRMGYEMGIAAVGAQS